MVVVKRQEQDDISWQDGRDLWWHELVPRQSPAFKTAVLDAEDLAMILYSSGTTGQPKGTLHRVAGVFAQVVKELGFQLVGPVEGRLACGAEGPGRMAEPQDIVEAIEIIASKIDKRDP